MPPSASYSLTTGVSCIDSFPAHALGSRWEARYNACSTASADSVTRCAPPRIASKHLDALARLHAGIETDVPGEGPDMTSQAIAGAKFRWPWQIDQPASLARLEVHDDTLGDGRGLPPFITSVTTPGAHRAVCHCSWMKTNRYPGKSSGVRTTLRPCAVRGSRSLGA